MRRRGGARSAPTHGLHNRSTGSTRGGRHHEADATGAWSKGPNASPGPDGQPGADPQAQRAWATLPEALQKALRFDGSAWWEHSPEPEDAETEPKTETKPGPEAAGDLARQAAEWYARATAGDAGGGASAGDRQWLATVLASGTTADRVAALTLQVRDAPVLRLRALDALLALAAKKARRDVLLALDALKDLFAQILLPPRRALRTRVSGRLPTAAPARARALVLAHFETQLAARYGRLLGALEVAGRDPVLHVRQRALKLGFELLVARPAHERPRLLALLANKLGDQEARVASQASWLLSQAARRHAQLKAPVAAEVQATVLRPNMAAAGVYHGVNALNQIMFDRSSADQQLARSLLHFYFTLFRTALRVGSPHDIRKRSAAPRDRSQKRLARRIRLKRQKRQQDRQSQPDIPADDDDEDEEEEDGRASSEDPPTMIVGNKEDAGRTEDEWVDSKLLGALLTGVNRTFPFASLRGDEADSPLAEHLDALFKIAHVSSFNKAVQALLVVFQFLAHQKQALADRFYRALYEKLLLLRELHASSKQALFLNVLFKALRADQVLPRVKAFVKRLLHVCAAQRPGFVCGALVLVSELVRLKPALLASLQQPEDDDTLEHFADADSASSEAELQPDGQEQQLWRFDWRKREPRFAGGERSSYWELVALASHFHPSVAVMAKQLLAGSLINYGSDPLADHSVAAFLDRFVEKKPKTPHAAAHAARHPLRAAQLPAVSSPAFAGLAEAAVPPDELFFYRYFRARADRKAHQRKRVRADRRRDADADDDSDLLDDDLAPPDAGGLDADDLLADDDEQESEPAATTLDEDGAQEDAEDDSEAALADALEEDSDELREPQIHPHMFDDDEDASDVDDPFARSRNRAQTATAAGGTFAAAAEFAQMLDEGGAPRGNPAQLAWEGRAQPGRGGRDHRGSRGGARGRQHRGRGRGGRGRGRK